MATPGARSAEAPKSGPQEPQPAPTLLLWPAEPSRRPRPLKLGPRPCQRGVPGCSQRTWPGTGLRELRVKGHSQCPRQSPAHATGQIPGSGPAWCTWGLAGSRWPTVVRGHRRSGPGSLQGLGVQPGGTCEVRLGGLCQSRTPQHPREKPPLAEERTLAVAGKARGLLGPSQVRWAE